MAVEYITHRRCLRHLLMHSQEQQLVDNYVVLRSCSHVANETSNDHNDTTWGCAMLQAQCCCC